MLLRYGTISARPYHKNVAKILRWQDGIQKSTLSVKLYVFNTARLSMSLLETNEN